MRFLLLFISIIFFINFSEENSSEFLLFSCEKGYVAHVRKALQAGANIQSRNYFKKTPLILAAENGSVEILNLLLQKGAAADIDARDRNGKTALFYAKKNGFAKIEKILLEYGAKE